MDEKELNMFGKFLFKYFYNKELTIPIKINKRLKRTSAWFVYYTDDSKQKPCIEVSQEITKQDKDVIADTLAHELTHYYLYKNKKPFDDNDMEFKSLVFQNGISETNTTIVRNGIVEYGYNQYTVKCSCGFHTNIYLFDKVKNFQPIIMCPNCKKRINNQKYVGMKYMKYQPTNKIKEIVDLYFQESVNKI